jgi:hypothetical protein
VDCTFSSSFKHDPAIVAARQKVSDAEEAERAADKALAFARIAVRESKEHIKSVEKEAWEEYSCSSHFSFNFYSRMTFVRPNVPKRSMQ